LTEANLNNQQNFSRIKAFSLTQGIYNDLARTLVPNTARVTQQNSVNFINEERINSQEERNNIQGASSNIANRRPSSTDLVDPIENSPNNSFKDSRRYSRGTQGSTQSNINNGSTSNTSPASHLRNHTLKLIRMFDTDGDDIVSDKEVFDYIMARRNANQSYSEKIKAVNSNADMIIRLIDSVDPNRDGIIDDQELINALLELRQNTKNDIPLSLINLVAESNSNREKIFAAIEKTDLDGTGIISDIEILKALINENLLGIEKDILYKVLSTNKNFDDIQDFLSTVELSGDGVLSNREVFNFLMAFRSRGFSISKVDVLEFLKENPKLAEIERSIEYFDPNKDGYISVEEYLQGLLKIESGRETVNHQTVFEIIKDNPKYQAINSIFSTIDSNNDGQYSTLELVQAWQKFKQGNLEAETDTFYTILNELSGSNKLSTLLNQIDTNADGNIDNKELLDLIMKTRSNINFKIDAETKAAIFSLNESSEIIEAAVNAIDKDQNGLISTKEVVEAIIAIRKKELAVDSQTLNQILSYNPNIAEIEELMNFIDQDKDGIFSGVEIFDSIMKVRQGSYTIPNQALFDDLIALSSSRGEVLTILNNYDPDKNGQISTDDYINAQIKIVKGPLQELPEDIRSRIDSLVPKSSIINQLISEIDSNSDGNHSVLELVQSWQKFKQGNFDVSEDIFYKIFNGLSGNTRLSSLLNQIDLNSDGNIDNGELIDLIMTIRSDRSFSIDNETKDAIFSLNPNSEFVEAAVNVIDKDGDGIISTKEVVEAIISIRKQELAIDNLTLNHILSYNPNIAEIEELMNFIDKDQDGVFSAIEVFNSFITVRQENYVISNQNLFDDLIAISESKDEVNRTLNLYDPDKNGLVSNEDYIKAQIGIRKKIFGEIPNELRTSIDSLVEKSDLINELISLIDTDADGVISDLELVKNYYKSFIINGVINVERKEMLDEILAITNPNAQELINIREKFDLDKSETISDQEVILGLLKVQRGEILNLGKEAFVALLHDNKNVAEIFDTIKILDRNGNGIIDNYEAMLSVIAESRDGHSPGKFTADILSMNSEYNAMRAELASFGINWSQNTIDLDNQLRAISLEIRRQNIKSQYFDMMLALAGKSALLEEKVMNELFDTNIDGVLTDLELVVGLEKHFNNQLNISNDVLINVLFKNLKYKRAYELIKAEMDAGRAIDYEDIISRIN
jgi:Ca2+-binding EF-hand superfamily protein